MELIAALTIWSMFACFLLFPKLGLPPILHRTAMTILTAELLALMLVSYGSGSTARLGRTAASVDVPALAFVLIVVVIIRAMRHGTRR